MLLVLVVEFLLVRRLKKNNRLDLEGGFVFFFSFLATHTEHLVGVFLGGNWCWFFFSNGNEGASIEQFSETENHCSYTARHPRRKQLGHRTGITAQFSQYCVNIPRTA